MGSTFFVSVRPMLTRQMLLLQCSLRWLCTTLLVLGGVLSFTLPALAAQDTSAQVVVLRIEREIDLGLVPYLTRGLDQAARERARAVVLEIDTPGGRLDAVLQMRDAILASPVRTIAFVNRTAFSAGALVAIASDEIYMAPGSVMGAAAPVDQAGEAASAKTISAVRKTFKATAELRGRDPRVAEAMVDPDVTLDDLNSRGQLLTLTATEALTWGYARAIVTDRQELLTAAELQAAVVTEVNPRLAENVVRFLTNPLVASLLISLGFLLILADLFSGGFGAIGVAGIGLFALFFWGHFLAGLAGWEGVVLVVLGLMLIALEIFVIPGFGLAGLLGGVALLGGLFISLLGGEIVTTADIERAGSTVLTTVAIMLAGVLLLIRFLPRAAAIQGLILQSQVGRADIAPRPIVARGRRSWIGGDRLEAHSAANAGVGQARPDPRSLTGTMGIALSDLRPAGLAEIAGARVDVITRGDYIDAGDVIEVILDEGYRRVVRRAKQD